MVCGDNLIIPVRQCYSFLNFISLSFAVESVFLCQISQYYTAINRFLVSKQYQADTVDFTLDLYNHTEHRCHAPVPYRMHRKDTDWFRGTAPFPDP